MVAPSGAVSAANNGLAAVHHRPDPGQISLGAFA
jgi:hypothetical protein